MKEFFFKKQDIALLAFFRIVGGAFLSFELINQYFTGDYREYIDPHFHFTYHNFDWVACLSTTGMYILFAGTILMGFMVSLGLFYRVTTVLNFIGYTWLFLYEKSEYVNHFYLYCLIAGAMIFLPAHRAYSLDVLRKPEIRLQTVPSWTTNVFFLQMCIVYFFAGVAKLHTDWFDAVFLKSALRSDRHVAFLDGFLTMETTPYLYAYLGVTFDLTISFFLLWKKTRKLAFIVACTFHFMNVLTFGLATFPWFSMLLTSLILPANWPRKVPLLNKIFEPVDGELDKTPYPYSKRIVYPIAVYFLIQLFLPLRHYYLDNDVNWGETHHRFSWHMMLRSKGGYISFSVFDRENNKWYYPKSTDYITRHQERKMKGKPDMILQFAHFLEEVYKSQGVNSPEVYVDCQISLNNRPYQQFIPRKLDLTTISRSQGHDEWIVPLEEHE